jgi:hypothetical protein
MGTIATNEQLPQRAAYSAITLSLEVYAGQRSKSEARFWKNQLKTLRKAQIPSVM